MTVLYSTKSLLSVLMEDLYQRVKSSSCGEFVVHKRLCAGHKSSRSDIHQWLNDNGLKFMDSSMADSTLILQQPLQVKVCAVQLDDTISSAAVEVKQPIVSEHMSSSIYLESNAVDNDFINSNWLSCNDHSQKSNQRYSISNSSEVPSCIPPCDDQVAGDNTLSPFLVSEISYYSTSNIATNVTLESLSKLSSGIMTLVKVTKPHYTPHRIRNAIIRRYLCNDIQHSKVNHFSQPMVFVTKELCELYGVVCSSNHWHVYLYPTSPMMYTSHQAKLTSVSRNRVFDPGIC